VSRCERDVNSLQDQLALRSSGPMR